MISYINKGVDSLIQCVRESVTSSRRLWARYNIEAYSGVYKYAGYEWPFWVHLLLGDWRYAKRSLILPSKSTRKLRLPESSLMPTESRSWHRVQRNKSATWVRTQLFAYGGDKEPKDGKSNGAPTWILFAYSEQSLTRWGRHSGNKCWYILCPFCSQATIRQARKRFLRLWYMWTTRYLVFMRVMMMM